MSIKIDLTGQRYGKLTVIGIAVDEVGKKKKWLCLCDCGKEAIISSSNLRSGHTKSCIKCGHDEVRSQQLKHGYSNTHIYYVWNTMLSRCERPNAKSYFDYGGRGIKVCAEWHDAATFISWALENGYATGMEIDRIDVDGDYCPQNCRFIPRLENANNKTNNKLIEYNGEIKTLADWSRYFCVNYKNLSRNLKKGYSLEEAVQREKTGDRTHRNGK